MRRGEAWGPLREHGKWMRLSERAVFYALLERSDNADCRVPAHMTPSLRQLAEACCCSKSTVVLALDHLEEHGWVTRKRTGKPSTGKPGAGHKTNYQLDHGWVCPDGCKYRGCREKGSDSRTLSREKGSDSRTAKGSDSHLKNRRSDTVSDVGISEGGIREGKGERQARLGATLECERSDPDQAWPDSFSWPDPDQVWLDAHPFDAMGPWPEDSIGAEMNPLTAISFSRAA